MNPKRYFKATHQMLLLAFFFMGCLFISCSEGKESQIYRVGILSGGKAFDDIADGFMDKMTELGYIEGKNITYDYRKAEYDLNEYRNILNKFAHDRVNLIFAFPTEPAVLAKEIAQKDNIPVVFAMAGVERNNLVDSVSSPGGNITGVRYPGPELTVKRLDILIELVPTSKKVYLLYDKKYPTTMMALEYLRPAATSLGITLVEDAVNDMEGLKAKLEQRSLSGDIGVDAILIMPDIINNSPEGFGSILDFAKKHKIPIAGGMDFTADRGALFSFVPDNIEQGELAATLAKKVLDGTPAGTIMLITPPARLRINYKVIKELDLMVSEGLLSRADEIIR